LRPIIHSQKHYVQMTLSTALTVQRNTETLCQAVAHTDKDATQEIIEGAAVKAIYVELWVIGTTADQFFTITLAKVQGEQTVMTFTEMTALGNYSGKKNILYTTQGLASNDGIAAPIPVIRQWFKIPKSKQRFGLNDKIVLSIASRGDASLTYCGFATYKEYT